MKILLYFLAICQITANEAVTWGRTLDWMEMPSFNLAPQYKQKREMIRRITIEAWQQYERETFGNTFGSDNATMNRQDSGQVVLGALSTFAVMDMPEEYKRARNWVANKFKFESLNMLLETNEVVVDMMGGLLSTYAITKDKVLLDKAKEMSVDLESVFGESNGMDSFLINPYKVHHLYRNRKRRVIKGSYNWDLEYRFLANQTNDQIIKARVKAIRKAEKLRAKEDGKPVSLSIIKSYLQSNGTDREALKMFKTEVNRMISNNQIVKSVCGMWFVRSEGDDEQTWGNNSMTYEKCNIGGLLSLANGYTEVNINKSTIASLVETCQIASEISESRLAPRVIFFREPGQTVNDNEQGNEFLLSPEMAESLFILYRKTGQQKYRDYAWSMVKQIYAKCRYQNGYFSVRNVCNENVQQGVPFYMLPHPRFISTTLKYLYLIFTEVDHFSLDQWVFNAAGHPFPIAHRLPDRSLIQFD